MSVSDLARKMAALDAERVEAQAVLHGKLAVGKLDNRNWVSAKVRLLPAMQRQCAAARSWGAITVTAQPTPLVQYGVGLAGATARGRRGLLLDGSGL